MKLSVQIGDRVVIHTPDPAVTKTGPFPIRGTVHAMRTKLRSDRISVKRDDHKRGAGLDGTWEAVADDAYMALESLFDSSKLVVTEDDDGHKTGKLEPKKTHTMGLDKEEISKDAWKAFKDLL